jgi:hypothetical protein
MTKLLLDLFEGGFNSFGVGNVKSIGKSADTRTGGLDLLLRGNELFSV